MPAATIQKRLRAGQPAPKLGDYERGCKTFSWMQARAELAGFIRRRGVNIAYEAVDRHVDDGRGGRVALRCISRDGTRSDISYSALRDASNRFASGLQSLGVAAGERICTLLGTGPAQYIVALGSWKRQAVFCPLHAGAEPSLVRARLAQVRPTVIVATAAAYRRYLVPMLDQLPGLRFVILTNGDAADGSAPNPTRRSIGVACRMLDFEALLTCASAHYELGNTKPETWAMLHFTAGSGKPRAAVHVHEAMVCHRASAVSALDLGEDDLFWCMVDPATAPGTSYGIIAPLVVGCRVLVVEGRLAPERVYRLLTEQRVNVCYTTPRLLEALAMYRERPLAEFDLGALRFVASCGRRLGAEQVLWGQQALGLPIHDSWCQPETGAIMLANYACLPIKPGAVGRPLPGIEAAVVRQVGASLKLLDVDRPGQLALRAGWPSMFRGYLDDEPRYRRRFAEGWYLSGELVRRDADGYFWLLGPETPAGLQRMRPGLAPSAARRAGAGGQSAQCFRREALTSLP